MVGGRAPEYGRQMAVVERREGQASEEDVRGTRGCCGRPHRVEIICRREAGSSHGIGRMLPCWSLWRRQLSAEQGAEVLVVEAVIVGGRGRSGGRD